MLSVGVGESPRETLSKLARLGAPSDHSAGCRGRVRRVAGARPLRAPARRSPRGARRGDRAAKRVQVSEGAAAEVELEIETSGPSGGRDVRIQAVPQHAEAAADRGFEVVVIGAFVRGLSMRDVESLCEQAGLGKLSKSTASRICEELKERFDAFRQRDLYEIRLVALFLDATCIAVRPDRPKEGVQVARGFTEDGERDLVGGELGDARVLRGLAITRAGSDQPWARAANADRRRRRARSDQGDRAVLAGVRPPTLLRSPRAQPVRQAA